MEFSKFSKLILSFFVRERIKITQTCFLELTGFMCEALNLLHWLQLLYDQMMQYVSSLKTGVLNTVSTQHDDREPMSF